MKCVFQAVAKSSWNNQKRLSNKQDRREELHIKEILENTEKKPCAKARTANRRRRGRQQQKKRGMNEEYRRSETKIDLELSRII